GARAREGRSRRCISSATQSGGQRPYHEGGAAARAAVAVVAHRSRAAARAPADGPWTRPVVVRSSGRCRVAGSRRDPCRRRHDSHHYPGCPPCPRAGETPRRDVANMKTIVLAYSGGVASCNAIHWLTETCVVDVVTMTLDVGQGEDLAVLRSRALACGARRAHAIDARDERVREFMRRSSW